MNMDYQEYRRLYNGLNTMKDIKTFTDEGYDYHLVETLLTQKVSRAVKKKFHIVKQRTPSMLRQWKNGRSIMEIAEHYEFPPVLTAMFIFQEDGTPRKEFWDIIKNPENLESQETAKEVRDAVANDPVYSPWANDRQRERGLWGEAMLWEWLDAQEIKYQTENDQRGEQGRKTPDCLLEEPMIYEGKIINWIESKASFGDNVEFKFNSKKQLIPYTELFGPGVVVYWTGYLEDMECPPNVYITDISILQKKLEKKKE